MNRLVPSLDMETMLRVQLIERGIVDERLLDAFRAVPRERFVPPAEVPNAYADRALPIGQEQTISQPYMVALMTARLDVKPEHRVLEIGTGSGYQAAILSKLAAEVYSVERIKPLLDSAFETLAALHIRNVKLRHADGTLGWPDRAPFDRVLIAAAGETIPETMLLDQLVEGGQAVLPVGPADNQVLLHLRKVGRKLEKSEICPVRFVPLISDS